MCPFSDDTAWVHTDDMEDPLYMHIPIVLKLATIHYYSVRSFSYVSLPVDFLEGSLMEHRLVYIANTDVHYSDADSGGGETAHDMGQLSLTAKGQEFLRKVPSASLISALVKNRKEPLNVDRNWRHYPYGVPRHDPNRVALWFMGGLTIPELPQFLAHEIRSIREKACELLSSRGIVKEVQR